MDFLLFSQGPLYRFFVKTGLFLYQRRILFICLLAWLPLLVLMLLSNLKLSTFFYDINVHVRLLVSLALLLGAEAIANDRFQIVVQQFTKCNIITAKDRGKYNALIASTIKFSNSNLAEILLFLFVFSVGRWISNKILPFDLPAWYGAKTNDTVSLTIPGYWYAFVSLPIFQFILLRWYYRIIIWYRFLWEVSFLDLQLNALHPDKAAGIGFLINNVYGLSLFLIAHSCLLAGNIFNYILNFDMSILQYKNEIIIWVLILLFIPLIPMFFFISKLIRAKKMGTKEYEVFANHYVTAFKKKWITAKLTNEEKLLGSADIQSLADLNNSFDVSEQMRIIPVGKGVIFFILIVTLLPFLPLIFTLMPIENIFTQIVKIIF